MIKLPTFDDNTRNLIVLGILSGMRANAGLLCASLLIKKQPGVYFSPDHLVKFFNNKKAFAGLTASGLGELVMDKLPITPDRIKPGGLSGRIAAGAIGAAAVNKSIGKNPVRGAVIGALAAVVSTFAFYYLRRSLVRTTKLKDPYIGAAEDVLVLAIATLMLKNNQVNLREIAR